MIAQVTLFELLSQGGWAMYPLGTLSLTLFALILFTWLQTTRGHFGLLPSRWTDVPLTRQLEEVLAELPVADTSPADRQARIDDFLESIEGTTLRWIQYLNVVATIAPMVGLLGTVSGMIGAFQTIATGGMGKPELLAGDIGEALITTATGLTIGIPAMIFYFVLRNRLEARLEELALQARKIPSVSGVASDLETL
ncbi:MAG: MotA/TolQ/ExbB proton channel family protein [Oceanipulchritudo sp.]